MHNFICQNSINLKLLSLPNWEILLGYVLIKKKFSSAKMYKQI